MDIAEKLAQALRLARGYMSDAVDYGTPCARRDAGLVDDALAEYKTARALDAKVVELAAAARFYFDNYCLDEADDWFDEGERVGENTGVTREQWMAVNRLRDALCAMSVER